MVNIINIIKLSIFRVYCEIVKRFISNFCEIFHFISKADNLLIFFSTLDLVLKWNFSFYFNFLSLFTVKFAKFSIEIGISGNGMMKSLGNLSEISSKFYQQFFLLVLGTDTEKKNWIWKWKMQKWPSFSFSSDQYLQESCKNEILISLILHET